MLMRAFLFLIAVSFSFPAGANFICTANSTNWGDLEDGLVFSKEFDSLDAQGSDGGHKLIFEDKLFQYWLVAGTMLKVGSQNKVLLDFYVELRDLKNDRIVRAKSGSDGDDKSATLELIHYPENSLFYDKQLLFKCSQY